MLKFIFCLFFSLLCPFFAFFATKHCFDASDFFINSYKLFSVQFKKKISQMMLLASNLCPAYCIFFYFLFFLSDQISSNYNSHWFICGFLLLYLDSFSSYKVCKLIFIKRAFLYLLLFFIFIFSLDALSINNLIDCSSLKTIALIKSFICTSFIFIFSFLFRKIGYICNFYIAFLFLFYFAVFVVKYNLYLAIFSYIVSSSIISYMVVCHIRKKTSYKYNEDFELNYFLPGSFYAYICFTFYALASKSIHQEAILLVVIPYFVVFALSLLNIFILSMLRKKIVN